MLRAFCLRGLSSSWHSSWWPEQPIWAHRLLPAAAGNQPQGLVSGCGSSQLISLRQNFSPKWTKGSRSRGSFGIPPSHSWGVMLQAGMGAWLHGPSLGQKAEKAGIMGPIWGYFKCQISEAKWNAQMSWQQLNLIPAMDWLRARIFQRLIIASELILYRDTLSHSCIWCGLMGFFKN